jgi:hypothetical protein
LRRKKADSEELVSLNTANPTLVPGSVGAPQLIAGEALQPFIRRIHAFENAVFGTDFACQFHSVEHWYSSRDYVSAAVIDSSVCNDLIIRAVASILITSDHDQRQLLDGVLLDSQLKPWTPGIGNPSLYLASIIADTPENLHAVYGTVKAGVEERLREIKSQPQEGFAIAAGVSGLQHLTKVGFVPSHHLYRGTYPVMTINAETARAPFWKELLTHESKHENVLSATN